MSGRGPGTPLTLPTTRDGRPILTRAELEAYDPGFRPSGGRERFYCPLHGSDHQRSLSVDPETGQYVCHTCGGKGTLREHWPDAGTAQPVRQCPTLEESGRQALARRRRADQERAERFAAAAVHPFIGQVPDAQDTLRAPGSLGAAYLHSRGLDSDLAAELGAGYVGPNVWPGDRGRHVGRIVYPLADPLTGRIVSAAGRLCLDAHTDWTPEHLRAFKGLKQRKLEDAPAGVWPEENLRQARMHRQPLVLVEGPADVLALTAVAGRTCHVLTLLGTSNCLPMEALKSHGDRAPGVAGVVLALDDDAGGAKGVRELRIDLALAGIRVEVVPAGWLGDVGATDLADLVDPRKIPDRKAADVCLQRAVALIQAACARLSTAPAPWDSERATDLIAALYTRCSDACKGRSEPWPELDERAIDAACQARDWPALMTAVAQAEHTFLIALEGLMRACT